MHKKKLSELTIKDNFMFGAVMIVQENCRKALERILKKRILKIKVDREKSLVYHPEYKGVRLDIEAEDEKHNIYNIEMQVVNEDVSAELVKFLKYIHADLNNSENDFDDEFVNQLQQTVRAIKSSKEMEMMYMQYNLTLQKEWNAGRIASKVEDILDALSALGTVSDSLNSRINEENNINVLKRWLKLAFRVQSIEQFVKEM